MRKAEPKNLESNYKQHGTSAFQRPNLLLLEELLDDLYTYLGSVGAPKSMLARINDMRQPIKYAREAKK